MMRINISSLDKLAKILFFIVLRFLIVGTAIMFLWNWLLPNLVNAVQINFLQAVGLMILGRLLTGGLRIGIALSAFFKKNPEDEDDDFSDLDKHDDEDSTQHKLRLKNELKERCKGQWVKEKQ